MTYNAKYDENANEIKCKDEPHNHNHEDDIGNCPYNICQCDRQFAHNLLANYRMCLNVSVLRLIHFQVYYNLLEKPVKCSLCTFLRVICPSAWMIDFESRMASIARHAWTAITRPLMINAVARTRNEFHTLRIVTLVAPMVSSVSRACAKANREFAV